MCERVSGSPPSLLFIVVVWVEILGTRLDVALLASAIAVSLAPR